MSQRQPTIYILVRLFFPRDSKTLDCKTLFSVQNFVLQEILREIREVNAEWRVSEREIWFSTEILEIVAKPYSLGFGLHINAEKKREISYFMRIHDDCRLK